MYVKNRSLYSLILASALCPIYSMNEDIEIKKNTSIENLNYEELYTALDKIIDIMARKLAVTQNGEGAIGKGTISAKLDKKRCSSLLHNAIKNEDFIGFVSTVLLASNITQLDKKGETFLDFAVQQNSRLFSYILARLSPEIDEKAKQYAHDPEIKKYFADTSYKIKFTEKEWQPFLKYKTGILSNSEIEDVCGNNSLHYLALAGIMPDIEKEDMYKDSLYKKNKAGLTPIGILIMDNNLSLVKYCAKQYGYFQTKLIESAPSFEMRKLLALIGLNANKFDDQSYNDTDDIVVHQPYTEITESTVVNILEITGKSDREQIRKMKKAMKMPFFDINRPLTCQHAGSTILNMAINWGHFDFAEFLIENGAIIGTHDLDNPVGKNDIEFVDYLFKHGATIPADDYNEYYLFDHAIDKNSLSMIELLVKNGGNLKKLCTNSDLLCAALDLIDKKNDRSIANYLLKNGANINAQKSCNKQTPLLYAIKNKLPKATKWCLKNGAAIDNIPEKLKKFIQEK